ncbi:MAG: ribonuclease R [Bacteroidia bacterium]
MKKKKTSTIKLESEILNILTENKGKILNHKQIYSRIVANTPPKRAEDLLPILNQLAKEDKIGIKDTYKFYRLMPRKTIEGTIEITRNGRAFLLVEGEEDDYVVGYSTINLLPFDKVEAQLVKQGKKKNLVDVVKLINHSDRVFAGVLKKEKDIWTINADSNKFQSPFVVKDDAKLKEAYKVLFKIKGFANEKRLPYAEITEIIGKSGDHKTEMHAILAEFGLPEKFTDEVQAASDEITEAISEKEIQSREDFRNVLTFTIDPDTAKDFDDAISFRKLKNGNHEIGVHIADVSHYVKVDSLLDKEALNRATSVYLVDRVVPMLPFSLSDIVCSLVPNKDRLTFSAIFEVNESKQVVRTRFAKTVIHSDKRFSYEEAQDVLNAGKGEHIDALVYLNEFAKLLSARRFEKGAMNFDSAEYRFVLDENFKPIALSLKQRQDTNKLIEELMLLANRSVAAFVYEQKPRKPFVYRTHDEPSDIKLQELKRFVGRFGYKLHIDDMNSFRTSIDALNKEVEGKPEQDMIQNMCIRSMAKATYTTNKPSHFGLAFQHYTHFTSPIRRYPDIIVHRLLFAYLNGKTMEKAYNWNMEKLDYACKQSSKMEILASDAERASIKYKQAEWMEQQVGKQFTGVISGMADFGMFIEIKEYKCEGMVRLSQIPGDHYEYDSYTMTVSGNRTHKRFKMGDEVQVLVSAANKIKRTIDLELILQNNNKQHHARKHRHFR